MSKIRFIFTTLVAIFIIGLYLAGNFDLFINPKYNNFTFIASLILLVLSLISLIYSFIKDRQKHDHKHEEDGDLKINIHEIKKIVTSKQFLMILLSIVCGILISPLFLIISLFLLNTKISKEFFKILKFDLFWPFVYFCMLLIMFAIPLPKQLSKEAVKQREGDLNLYSVSENTSLNVNNFNTDSKNYSIGDWVASLNYNPDLNSYKDKEVNIVGFVYNLANKTDEFLAARFVITCCAVDARPVGLKVKLSDWAKQFKEEQWVSINGKFIVENDQLYIVPNKIAETQIPAQPYIF